MNEQYSTIISSVLSFHASQTPMNFNRPLFDKLQAVFKAVVYFLFALAFFDILAVLFSPFAPDSWQHGIVVTVFTIPTATFVVWKTLKQEKAGRLKQSRK